MTDFNQKTHDTDVGSDSWTFRLRKNHIFEDVKWSFGAGARCECVRQNYVGGGGYPQSIHGRVEKNVGLVFQTPAPFPFSIYKNLT